MNLNVGSNIYLCSLKNKMEIRDTYIKFERNTSNLFFQLSYKYTFIRKGLISGQLLIHIYQWK